MDSRSDRTVALMSIHPQFADLIIAGEKRVEFRKTSFRTEFSHVLIYCTEPVRMVVGCFEVADLDAASPRSLWERYEKISGISQETFEDYYANCSVGVAIKIGRVFRFQEPLPLSAVGEAVQPPQSFKYLKSKVLESLTNELVLTSSYTWQKVEVSSLEHADQLPLLTDIFDPL